MIPVEMCVGESLCSPTKDATRCGVVCTYIWYGKRFVDYRSRWTKMSSGCNRSQAHEVSTGACDVLGVEKHDEH